MNQREPYEAVAKDFALGIGDAFRELLQNKHLYQSVSLEKLLGELRVRIENGGYPFPEHSKVGLSAKETLFEQFNTTMSLPWIPGNSAGFVIPVMNISGGSAIQFIPPSVKLYCPECDRAEPHNPIYADHYRVAAPTPGPLQKCIENETQWFGLGYECQSCKGLPVLFLIQRVRSKLTLTGRSPIQQTEVPKFLPKDQRRFYSSALVAHQSGQTLAGIFFLRTLIEQVARTTVTNSQSYKTGNELMEAYMTTLQETVRREFPSMKKLYEDLSADMHAAKGDVKLFEDAVANITKHFQAKELFNRP